MKKIRIVFLNIFLLLIMTPSVTFAVLFDFDDGTMQGWSEGDPFNVGSFGGTLSLINSGGNPDGYLRAFDTRGAGGGSLAVLAPLLISGNLSLFEGLTWDELIPSGASFATSALIEGADGTFYRSNFGLSTTGVWNQRIVDFTSSADWNLLSGTGAFDFVVSNASAFYLELDVISGINVSEAGIDNVRTLKSMAVSESASVWLLTIGLLCFVVFKNRSWI